MGSVERTNSAASGPARKKQKRNKPTLSCAECVERKTKCDRNRPSCFACLRRQSECRYSEVANLIASAATNGSSNARRSTKATGQGKATAGPDQNRKAKSVENNPTEIAIRRSTSVPSFTSLPLLLSNLTHPNSTPSKIFGEGSEFPFSNYWTNQGGLPEVVGVLPSKDQADILVNKYFATVDAVYPIIDKYQFLVDYERFWSLPTQEKHATDPALLGLHFVVYAMGTQFIELPSDSERKQVAEFYASAAHQALKISSYLNRGSCFTVQAIVLLCYFLMNDNKASDAWGFGGVLVRHVYAMGLNRDPEIVVPEASAAEKQQRRKLWQAVLFQDTFLTVLLKLPPTTTFTDVQVESLIDEPDTTPSTIPETSPPMNPMSISSIAPSPSAMITSTEAATPPPSVSSNDTTFIRCMWRLANFVQRQVSTPRALGHPIASTNQEKAQLVASFKAIFDSFPVVLTTADPTMFLNLVSRNRRQGRQNLFLRSNYWHCVMLIQADESQRHNVARNIQGAIEAGRKGMWAFFNLADHYWIDAGVWWVFQHRAFEEALTVAEMLGAVDGTVSSPTTPVSMRSTSAIGIDPFYAQAKADVVRMLGILEQVGSSAPEMQKTRTEVLRKAVENIRW